MKRTWVEDADYWGLTGPERTRYFGRVSWLFGRREQHYARQAARLLIVVRILYTLAAFLLIIGLIGWWLG